MRLIRNNSSMAKNKYALLDARAIARAQQKRSLPAEVQAAIDTLDKAGLINWGEKFSPEEFVAIKLKDVNSQACFRAYAYRAEATDPELARDMYALAQRSGPAHPNCKIPD